MTTVEKPWFPLTVALEWANVIISLVWVTLTSVVVVESRIQVQPLSV
jgi:hypothetical protein